MSVTIGSSEPDGCRTSMESTSGNKPSIITIRPDATFDRRMVLHSDGVYFGEYPLGHGYGCPELDLTPVCAACGVSHCSSATPAATIDLRFTLH
jgi:hypothetical protein